MKVHLSPGHAYLLQRKESSNTIDQRPGKSLPSIPSAEAGHRKSLSVASSSSSSSGSSTVKSTSSFNLAEVAKVVIVPKKCASMQDLAKLNLDRFKVGDKVDLKRNNGRWVEGIVVEVQNSDIQIQYSSSGAKYKKKLKADSNLIAPHLSKVKRVSFSPDC
jgi:hypothetical protein